jgi:hypothetical protein
VIILQHIRKQRSFAHCGRKTLNIFSRLA